MNASAASRAAVFDALPGLEAPVGAISGSLASLWSDTAADGRAAPASEDATATQVNLVLHLGFKTTVEDALAQFNTAVRFSRRCPSRVLVLCALEDQPGAEEIRAKVYGECSIGKSKGDTRCCEFVMLSYPRSTRRHLENQVSVCLSVDLPLYYWAHRFSSTARLADYPYLLKRSTRVILDSATAPEGAWDHPWPRPEIMRDLAYARLLPVRQSVGQFLSRYEMPILCGGLRRVTVTHGLVRTPEAGVLLAWARDRLGQCGGGHAAFACVPGPDPEADTLSLSFEYEGSKSFLWTGDFKAGRALFTADLGTGRTVFPAAVGLLCPENALSESMFF